ncbi:MAG: hypothetical protein ACR2K2_01205 [Mycobacteriales bacterium]
MYDPNAGQPVPPGPARRVNLPVVAVVGAVTSVLVLALMAFMVIGTIVTYLFGGIIVIPVALGLAAVVVAGAAAVLDRAGVGSPVSASLAATLTGVPVSIVVWIIVVSIQNGSGLDLRHDGWAPLALTSIAPSVAVALAGAGIWTLYAWGIGPDRRPPPDRRPRPYR